MFDSSFREDHHTYTLKIKNVGLGPALIENYKISLNKVNELDPHSVFEELLRMVNTNTPAKGRAHCVANYLHTGDAVDKGNEKILIQVSLPTDGRSFMEGRQIAKELVNMIELSVFYKCHYGSTHVASKKHNAEPNKRLKSFATLTGTD
ncbi:hypothetical protein U8L64_10030 [Pseudomonas sp. FIP_A4]|uniref:hypothetical protein n=1 Tax=Pseudomonas sp. FIP_A4 TaxID=3070684 RepID=UPI0010FF94ED|nr:hypothetical protein FEV13_03555 [Stutzerimonas degradans]